MWAKDKKKGTMNSPPNQHKLEENKIITPGRVSAKFCP